MRLLILCVLLTWQQAYAQTRQVAITIDDVPNVEIFKRQGFNSILLKQINTLDIPAAIFINEHNILLNEFTDQNRQGLVTWLRNKHITAGNHGYQHLNYADTTRLAFEQEVIEGEMITSKTLKKLPAYFRFPYNSMGNDSLDHAVMRNFLQGRGYTVTPFTIESQDWAFNGLYEDALKHKDAEKAKQIAQRYITHTLALFDYFENLSQSLYGRPIRHIYLCHDNQLNTDYLSSLVSLLKEKGYAFISLDTALKDDVYRSRDYYTGKFGFSWMYRWIQHESERKRLMRLEPVDSELN